MFCANCGAQLPEGSVFCGNCGSRQPTPQNEYWGQPVVHTPVTPEKKSVFLKEQASAGAKRNSRLVLITSLLCILLLVVSVVSCLTRSLFRIPMISTAIRLSGAAYELTEALDDLEYSMEEAEEEYDRYEDTYSRGEQEAYKKMLQAMKKTVKRPSLLNFRNIVSVMEEVAPELQDDFSDSDLYEIHMVRTVLDAIIAAVLGSILLPALFFLLGGLKKSLGWNIAALVLSLLPQMILGGTLLTLALLAAGIAAIVFCSKINQEYDRYCSYCLNGR